MKRNWKKKIPHTVLEIRTFCFSSYKNHKWNVKLWWVEARGRKKRAFFVPFILSEGNFFNKLIYVNVYCIKHSFKKHYFITYQKALLHTLFFLFLKSWKAFSVSLIHITIALPRLVLYLIYLCSGLVLGLFMSYLYDLFFIFSHIFIAIKHLTSIKRTYLFFVNFLEHFLLFLDDNVDEESEKFWNCKCSASECCLAFAWLISAWRCL